MPFIGAYTRPIGKPPVNPRFFTYAGVKPAVVKPAVVKKPVVAFIR